MKLWLAGLAVLLTGQSVWAQGAIRLKNRAFRPAQTAERTEVLPRGSHLILRFGEFPGPAIREELARRHMRVLGYVPDSALLVSSDGLFDLEGLGVTWSGPLEAADKISPQLARGTAAAYLVVFHPDVEPVKERELVQAQGFDVLENPYLLPGNLLVAGNGRAIAGLAASDEVAYIFPASTDLVSGYPVMGCAGPVTEAGLIAEYVEVGQGWSKDSSGNVALQYLFQTLTDKLDQATVKSEIERALREWQKYANITLSAGGTADAVRTIAIQFARGAHGDAYPFDGPGGILAHTFYPAPPNAEPVAGDMHLDADEAWHVGSATDLFSVALHEAGHALGLGHSSSPGAVMYPYYRFSSGLTDDDIAGIRDLYGAAGSQTPPVQPPVTPPVQPPVTPPVQPPVTPPSQPPSKPPAVDATPPSIRIVSPSSTIASTTLASIHIAGTASDDVGVTAVKWSTSNGDAGNASGTTAWSADIPLLVGNTVVTVRANDAAGNSGWRTVTVVRH
jgi:hypothetical protein